jgi:hypothetical protein
MPASAQEKGGPSGASALSEQAPSCLRACLALAGCRPSYVPTSGAKAAAPSHTAKQCCSSYSPVLLLATLALTPLATS